MVNVELLRQHIKERRIPIETIAKSLDISASSVYRMLNTDGGSITISQAEKLRDILSLTQHEFRHIFLQ